MLNHKLGKSVYPDTIRSLVLYIMMSQTNDDILQDTLIDTVFGWLCVYLFMLELIGNGRWQQ
jgi:hypothetical protein